uniref:Macrocypin-5a n=1 Tax=Macrolepiota procera TaxID=56183 RepID=MCP5A_MACPC|nr:RecName: Full=Macrocypin-5a [Macrolepiota procera]ACL99734.1 macrocypin 5a [Macrolepiota procera]
MGFEDGFYTIRHLVEGQPPNIPGGMYASSKDGKDEPVTAEPLGPHSKIRWWIARYPEAGEDMYTITEFRVDESIPGQWARPHNEVGGPVYLYDRIRAEETGYVCEWRIQPAYEDVDGVFNIMGNSRIGSTDWADLREEGGKPQVYLKPVPVVPNMYIPRWFISKVD